MTRTERTEMDMTQIQEMVSAYIDCALWSSVEDGYWDDDANVFVVQESRRDNDAETVPLDEYFDSDDIASETEDRMIEDCEEFYTANAEDLADMTAEQAGHDFWLTRNRHGAGFWDRGLGELGERLSSAAKVYGSFDLYVGDDGKVYGQ